VDQTISTVIRAGVPTIAVIVGSVRSTTLINRLCLQIDGFIARLYLQIEAPERFIPERAEPDIQRPQLSD
jgi:hypothetical protein